MVTANYSYDARHRLTGLDRRIAKAVDADGAGPGTAVTTRFAYDGEHILLQFDETALAQRYLHGPVIDQILAAEDVTTLTSPGSLLWPLADHQGTVRDLVDSSGTVLNHLTYDAFGQVTSETNAAVDFLFAYTGRERDEETGLYYYRARYYDPAVGRFVSEDPIGFAAGDVNVSRYVGNRVTDLVDPSGLQEGLPPARWDIRLTFVLRFDEGLAPFSNASDPTVKWDDQLDGIYQKALDQYAIDNGKPAGTQLHVNVVRDDATLHYTKGSRPITDADNRRVGTEIVIFVDDSMKDPPARGEAGGQGANYEIVLWYKTIMRWSLEENMDNVLARTMAHEVMHSLNKVDHYYTKDEPYIDARYDGWKQKALSKQAAEQVFDMLIPNDGAFLLIKPKPNKIK